MIWSDFCYEDSFWMTDHNLYLTRRMILIFVFACCLFFRCKKNMNSLVLSLAPKFVKLQTLVLRQDKPQLEDNAVEAIANHCHELQDLDLSKSSKITDHSLYSLARGCTNLTKLNLSGCTSFSDTALAHLTRFCRKLKILNLCGCVEAVSDNTLQVAFKDSTLSNTISFLCSLSR